ncbi:MAG: hypothetical protein AABX07_06110 [Nanoarchaeota archaeon]
MSECATLQPYLRRYVFPFVLCNPLLRQLCSEFLLMYREGRREFNFEKDICLQGRNSQVNEAIAQGLRKEMNGESERLRVFSSNDRDLGRIMESLPDNRGIYFFCTDAFVSYPAETEEFEESFKGREIISSLDEVYTNKFLGSLCGAVISVVSNQREKPSVCVYGENRRVNYLFAERLNLIMRSEEKRGYSAFAGEKSERKNLFYLDMDKFLDASSVLVEDFYGLLNCND